MTAADLWHGLRRAWPLALIALLLPPLLLTRHASRAQRDYAGTTTLSIQPLPLPDGQQLNFNVGDIQLMLPVLASRATSSALKEAAQAKVGGASDTNFSVSSEIVPAGGLVTVTVTSKTESVIIPILKNYADQLVRYPGTAALPAVVTVVQPPGDVQQESKRSKVAVAGAEGLVLGGILAVALSLAAGHWRRRHDVEARITGELGQRILGRVPRRGQARGSTGAAVVPVVTDLRRRLDSGSISLVASVAFVSPRTGVGRTTLATWTARRMAETGTAVLLVEADLRRPGIDAALNEQSNESRVTHDLAHAEALAASTKLPITATAVPYLYVLRASAFADYARAHGAQSTAPWATVVSAIRAVLTDAAAAGLFCIVDTPASPGDAEADAVAGAVGGVIVVADGRRGARAIGDIAASLERVQHVDGHSLGVVINRWRRPMGLSLTRRDGP